MGKLWGFLGRGKKDDTYLTSHLERDSKKLHQSSEESDLILDKINYRLIERKAVNEDSARGRTRTIASAREYPQSDYTYYESVVDGQSSEVMRNRAHTSTSDVFARQYEPYNDESFPSPMRQQTPPVSPDKDLPSVPPIKDAVDGLQSASVIGTQQTQQRFIPEYISSKAYESSQTLQTFDSYLFDVGFLCGHQSDVSIELLGKVYRLHKFILNRCQFFKKVFDHSDERSYEIAVTDINVTAESVNICLAFLYGKQLVFDPLQKQENFSIYAGNCIAVLSASLYFGLRQLTDFCLDTIQSILVQLSTTKESLSSDDPQCQMILNLVRLVEDCDYGDSVTGALEESVLNTLCANGYHHLEAVFVELPPSWLERILEADAFWCPTEFARYEFVKSVVSLRKLTALKATKIRNVQDEELYGKIFKNAIIYSHMTFEQLHQVKSEGLVDDSVLMSSLWQSTQFRAYIEGGKVKKNVPATNGASQLDVPLRVGVTFPSFQELRAKQRCYSNVFFFAGSWWSCFLQRFPAEEVVEDPGNAGMESHTQPQSGEEKWGIFLRRSEGYNITKAAQDDANVDISHESLPRSMKDVIIDPLTDTKIDPSVSYYHDNSEQVTASFSVFNPKVKSFEPVFESKVNQFAETQSWGYRSVDHVVTPSDITHNANEVKFSLVMKIH
ncbi:hypothetical protein MIR68_012580 [Amoeboaphelidium protococcarum]|nr:hypothetical protein MIR68_012580 [Amoeboaphelidium protococcarum]